MATFHLPNTYLYIHFTKVPWLLLPNFQADAANMYAVGTIGTFRTLKECVAWNLVAYEIPGEKIDFLES